jgi:hypothetical protein
LATIALQTASLVLVVEHRSTTDSEGFSPVAAARREIVIEIDAQQHYSTDSRAVR